LPPLLRPLFESLCGIDTSERLRAAQPIPEKVGS